MTRYQKLNALTIMYFIIALLLTCVVDDIVLLPFVFLSFFASYICHDEMNKEWKQIVHDATMDRPE